MVVDLGVYMFEITFLFAIIFNTCIIFNNDDTNTDEQQTNTIEIVKDEKCSSQICVKENK